MSSFVVFGFDVHRYLGQTKGCNVLFVELLDCNTLANLTHLLLVNGIIVYFNSDLDALDVAFAVRIFLAEIIEQTQHLRGVILLEVTGIAFAGSHVECWVTGVGIIDAAAICHETTLKGTGEDNALGDFNGIHDS